jgi:hypothetical protein
MPHSMPITLIKKYVGKVTTSMKDEKRFFSKKGGHEICTHISQISQSLWYIFYSVYGTIMGGKCFAFCVCVCVCNALNRTKKLPVLQKEISIYCTKSPILSWTAYTLNGNVGSYLHTDKLRSVSQKSCIFTKAVVTSNLVMVTYLQISNLYQRHA